MPKRKRAFRKSKKRARKKNQRKGTSAGVTSPFSSSSTRLALSGIPVKFARKKRRKRKSRR